MFRVGLNNRSPSPSNCSPAANLHIFYNGERFRVLNSNPSDALVVFNKFSTSGKGRRRPTRIASRTSLRVYIVAETRQEIIRKNQ